MVEKLLVLYTPHTTWKDAEFVSENFQKFQPQVFIPGGSPVSYKKLHKLRGHYEDLAGGKRELDRRRPFYNFNRGIVNSLRKDGGKIKFHFLDVHLHETIVQLENIHKEELKHRRAAQSLFDQDNLDEACDEVYQSLVFKSQSGKIRARGIEENAKNLSKDIFNNYPELSTEDEVRIQAYLSGVYLSPVVQLGDVVPIVIEKPQRIPYTSLTHVEMVRNMILDKEINLEDLPRYFVENTIERQLRDNIPDSVERFEFCRNVSEKLDKKTINKKRIEEILNSLAIEVKT